MNQRLASAFAFTSTCVAATLAAALMTGNALAEGPIFEDTTFVSTRSRADVRAELMASGGGTTSAASEWVAQLNDSQPMKSQYTRAQARAEYIAARDQVHEMTAEHSGAAYFAQAPIRARDTVVAGSAAR